MAYTEVKLDTFTWIDYTNPSTELLGQIAAELCLESRVLYNCLDPDYLPHIEFYPETQFLILRMMEPESRTDADSVQELTTKIAIFISSNKIITIHRLPLSEVDAVIRKLKEATTNKINRSKLISFFYEQVSLGFDRPLTDLEFKLHNLEENLFSRSKSRNFFQQGFYLKRKASAFKKVLKLTLELLSKLVNQVDFKAAHFQQSRDRLERSLFYAEDVYENVQSLLNLHMAIEAQLTNDASFRTNEIVRVLTVLTIFFLPLNFIAGIFGMNFQVLPLLMNPHGFWISIFIMLAVSMLLGLYLLKQGWLGRPKIKPEATIPEENDGTN